MVTPFGLAVEHGHENRSPRRGALRGGGRRHSLVLLTLAGHAFFGREAAGQDEFLQIVRWNVSATVTEVGDPGGIFSSVRLGDAVHGTLTYDINTGFYPPWIGIVGMTIEDPRTGQDLRFISDPLGPHADIWNFDFDEPPRNDELQIIKSVMPPTDFPGLYPAVAALFRGPLDVLSGENPLANLQLDDWPIAVLAFLDLTIPFDIQTYIYAEINSMTPNNSPLADGDFNYDGVVDAADLQGWSWSKSFEELSAHFADADHDGDSDGGDFLIWQRQLGANEAFRASAHVPEPEALTLAAIFLLSVLTSRRRD